MNDESSGFEKDYTEEGFWGKVGKHAKEAGNDVIDKGLTLYFTLQEPGIPAWARTVIIGALGYFISPIDAIPDLTPIVGFADDLGVLVAAIATVSAYIPESAKDQARLKLSEWFKW